MSVELADVVIKSAMVEGIFGGSCLSRRAIPKDKLALDGGWMWPEFEAATFGRSFLRILAIPNADEAVRWPLIGGDRPGESDGTSPSTITGESEMTTMTKYHLNFDPNYDCYLWWPFWYLFLNWYFYWYFGSGWLNTKSGLWEEVEKCGQVSGTCDSSGEVFVSSWRLEV